MFRLSALLLVCAVSTSVAAQDGAARLKPSGQLGPASAPAAESAADAPVGFVKTVSGQAFVVTGGQAVAANPGTPVLQGSVLKTGPDSSLGVTFKDSTMMSFGPETELKVDEYLYQPASGKLSFASSLVRGTLNYVSGVIAKLRPDGVSITTPTAMIGVRGTQLVAKVHPPAP